MEGLLGIVKFASLAARFGRFRGGVFSYANIDRDPEEVCWEPHASSNRLLILPLIFLARCGMSENCPHLPNE